MSIEGNMFAKTFAEKYVRKQLEVVIDFAIPCGHDPINFVCQIWGLVSSSQPRAIAANWW